MSDQARELATLWKKLDAGQGSDQDKVDAAILAGKLEDRASVQRLQALLEDPYEEARYYALSALVHGIGHRDAAMKATCWRMLAEDPDPYVRMKAAGCLGSFYFGSDDLEAFERLKRVLQSGEHGMVKAIAYSSLFQIRGLPPSEWPDANLRQRRVFNDADVDWRRVAELEDEVRAARSRGS